MGWSWLGESWITSMRKVRAGVVEGALVVVRRMMMDSAPPRVPRLSPSQSRMMVGEDFSAETAMETELALSQSIGADDILA